MSHCGPCSPRCRFCPLLERAALSAPPGAGKGAAAQRSTSQLGHTKGEVRLWDRGSGCGEGTVLALGLSGALSSYCLLPPKTGPRGCRVKSRHLLPWSQRATGPQAKTAHTVPAPGTLPAVLVSSWLPAPSLLALVLPGTILMVPLCPGTLICPAPQLGSRHLSPMGHLTSCIPLAHQAPGPPQRQETG